ncbi:MAG: type II toxin-antitoxin system RelE/ParE family toxin [Pirellulales bacterium]|nr:type II toxin-antitoxin system RelE/ParE family toxin [Pirellulales bacterium]
MEARPQEIRYYHTSDAKSPFLDWLNNLRDKRAQQRIDARLARIEAGLFGDSKRVGEGVQELRVNYGPGYRLYYGRDGSQVVIMLCGGDKSTQVKDIAKAKEYWADYKARKMEE